MTRGAAAGFTLIEVLIVIAIIGILAAVMIPTLLGARRAAEDRAAQAFGSNVYTALNGYLALTPNRTTTKVLTDFGLASGGSCATDITAVTATSAQFNWRAPAPYIHCTVTAGGGYFDFTVLTYAEGSSNHYTNGR